MNAHVNVIYGAGGFGTEGVGNFKRLCEGRGAQFESLLPFDSLTLQCSPASEHITERHEASRYIDVNGIEPHDDAASESFTTSMNPDSHQPIIQAHSEVGIFRALCALTMGESSRRHTTPHYLWRSLCLDVARYQASIQEIERVIDLLALHGMSVLHLHLTDHQSWRIPVDGFDKLLQSPGCFTWEQLDSLRRYAKQRYLTLVPEIDMPGHCASLLQRYPELSGKPSFIHPLVSYIDAHAEESQRFLQSCAASLARVASGDYVHIGGDEVLGMPDSDYDMAMTMFQDAVHDLGLKTIAWQEGCRGKVTADAYQFWMDRDDIPSEDSLVEAWPKQFSAVAKQAAAMYALCYDDPQRLQSKGSPVIDSQQSTMYFDRKYQEPSLVPEQNERMKTLGFPGYAPKPSQDCLNWTPLSCNQSHDHPTDTAASSVLTRGVEAALWTETIRSTADLDMLLLPRLALIADCAWNGTPEKIAGNPCIEQFDTYAHVWNLCGFHDFYRSSSLFSDAA
ncbi:family 20 glycosylhydrolase [Bifidobacterium aquikefiricola]|uniref:beta-N-acetylhexosaminidase n=1 Tax=Bifidobacterium aquikefiricola TaxID=3059038 RepID=A0AB39U6L0_9BIFI